MKLSSLTGPVLSAKKTWPDGLSPTITVVYPGNRRYQYMLDTNRTADQIWQIGRRWPGRAAAMLKELVNTGTAEVQEL